MSIWFKQDLTMADIASLGKGTMEEHIGIEWVAVGEDFLKARMPVDHRTRQPYGLLHGGASLVLAETIGSIASAMVIDHEKFLCVGIEINGNHVRGVKEGYVIGVVKPVHLGKSTHVWDIRIHDENNKLVCISRLTVAILKRS